MSEINEKIVVNIEVGQRTVTRQGFGIPLILGTNANFNPGELVRTYNSLDAVKADFEEITEEYQKAHVLFSQLVVPPSLRIAQCGDKVKMKVKITVENVENSTEYVVYLNGTRYAYTSDSTATADEIVDGLIAAITAGSEPVTLTDNGDNFDIEAYWQPQVQTISFDSDFVVGNTIDLKINGVSMTQVPFNTTHDQTMADIAAQIIADFPTIIDNVDTGATGSKVLTLTGKIQGEDFTISEIIIAGGTTQPVATIAETVPSVSGLTFSIKVDLSERLSLKSTAVYTQDIATTLNAIREQDDDWYFITPTITTASVIKSISDYVEPLVKHQVVTSFDSDIITTATDDIASQLKGLNYSHVSGSYSPLSSNKIDTGIIGYVAPKDPGSLTWANKNLVGVTVDKFTDTVKQRIKDKKFNYYVDFGGLGTYQNGIVSDNTVLYSDVARGRDWLSVNIQAEIADLLVNTDKIPYNDEGIAMVENAIRAVLRAGQAMQFIAVDPEFVITVPKSVDVPVVDKTDRILRNMFFYAYLVGAIHKILVVGKVTY